jgi:ABC-type molybdate transport system substrate-binding protein
MFRRIAVAISIAVALPCAAAPAGAAELKVMGAGPVEGTVKELVPTFVRETGHKVEGVFNTVGFIQDQLKAGERPDILILSAPVMEAMEKDGSLPAPAPRSGARPPASRCAPVRRHPTSRRPTP